MSLKTTFISRASDGLILCETYDSSSSSQTERLKLSARDLLKRNDMFTSDVQCSVDIEDHRFHFMTKSGVVYLTMADQKYPQKLAFVFLSEISQLFDQELQNTYGTAGGVDYLSKIETIDNQYAFLKFEKAINKKKRDFRDVNAAENINKLNQELMDVNKIMTESFEMLLNREKNLGQISEKSSRIRDSSRDFRKEAKKLKMAFWFRKYTTPIVLVLLVLFMILMKFFVFG